MNHSLCACLLVVLLGVPPALRAEPALRVRLLAGVEAIALGGDSLHAGSVELPSELSATARGERLRLGPLASGDPVMLQAEGPIRVDGLAFPGAIELVPRGHDRLDVINVVPLERYVEQSVAAEVYADWPDEVLKAQAVAIRTYALHEHARHEAEDYDLEASVLSQRYAAGAVPGSVRRAVHATQGEILSWGGQPILAAFHSSSGGRTASAAEVWGLDLPYLGEVASPDDAAPDYFWSYEIGLADLRAALGEAGYAGGEGNEVRVLARSPSGRVARLRIAGAELSGRELRQVLGGRAIRSALFEVRSEDGVALFLGSGAGHGVGLCQWGARELARRGESYAEILAHYYPGTDLRPLSVLAGASEAGKALK